MLEPTYNFLLIEDVASWGKGIVLDDGLFLACEGNIQESINKEVMLPQHYYQEKVFSTLHFRVTVLCA